ncbi:hypothetical protein GJU40_00945 [Bacillus lacus]|uniref:Uncharacterized protein n=1 Tax=Metabacillus lacus TaxID=1983721 RepID=A0A7X2IW63_9BACI|nr:hypothetical protein [Metabacillus lacus]MRX70735.1 hypothetical protein [Metabacillus lacus]
MFIQGDILAGELDSQINEFSLQKVKHLETQSVLNEKQLSNILHYLKKHQHEEGGQIITLYDQMPVHLSQQELNSFISDLESVLSKYN